MTKEQADAIIERLDKLIELLTPKPTIIGKMVKAQAKELLKNTKQGINYHSLDSLNPIVADGVRHAAEQNARRLPD